MDKVYIVECTSGSFDDSSWFIIGVYSTAELAEEGKRKWLSEILHLRYEKFTNEEVSAFLRMHYNAEIIPQDKNVRFNEFKDWYYGMGHMNLFSANVEDLKIREIPINTMIYKFDFKHENI